MTSEHPQGRAAPSPPPVGVKQSGGAASASEALPRGPRWTSVDALRGLAVAAMLLVNNPGDWDHVWAPLRHAPWHGFTPTDFIFPLFLFIVGVSLTLAIEPALERGANPALLRRQMLMRALRIVLLGLALHALAWWWLDRPHFRPMGVLQRIGLCVALAVPLALHARARTQWLLAAALLLLWWALLAGDLAKGSNLADRVDTALLGPLAYQFDAARGIGHDPEGLASTLGALATTLLGLRAGAWLRRGQRARLGGAALALLALGGLLAPELPLNKALWTSSFVLVTGGLSMAVLWLAHEAVDRRGLPALGRSFGVNALAVYAGGWVMEVALAASPAAPAATRSALDWLSPRIGAEAASFAYALLFTLLWWGVARVLLARGIRIRL